MTNELEKQFFQCFGVEPKCQNTFINPSKCPFIESRECCDCVSFEYPQITDHILLGLICINSDEEPDIEWLKNSILQELIHRYKTDNFCNTDQVKHQLRTLFKEG